MADSEVAAVLRQLKEAVDKATEVLAKASTPQVKRRAGDADDAGISQRAKPRRRVGEGGADDRD